MAESQGGEGREAVFTMTTAPFHVLRASISLQISHTAFSFCSRPCCYTYVFAPSCLPESVLGGRR